MWKWAPFYFFHLVNLLRLFTFHSILSRYAVAAAKMGERGWVKEGMQWCANRALSFHHPAHSLVPPSSPSVPAANGATSMSNTSELPSSSLTSLSLSPPSPKISSPPAVRLLDVGSCYNPFARDPSLGGSALQVLATITSILDTIL